MSDKIEDLVPQMQPKINALISAAMEKGIHLKITQTLRTFEEQDFLYEMGRSVPGLMCRHSGESRPRPIGNCTLHPMGLKVTKAKGGYSWHNYGRAADVAIVTYEGDKTPLDLYDGPWLVVGILGEQQGLEWGGRWINMADTPHFQLRDNMKLADLRRGYKVRLSGIIPVTG